MTLVRLTLDLLRPVPVTPLRLDVAALRPGRRLDVSQVVVRDGETAVARAVGLRLRLQDVAVPLSPTMGPPPAPGEAAVEWWPEEGFAAGNGFHHEAVEIRMVSGNFAQPGPGTGWVRLKCAVVAGSEVLGVERAAAASDFINGMSAYLSPAEYLFINPDLSVFLARPPHGEWIGLAATSLGFATGTGNAEARLYDMDGDLGRSVQSLIFEPRL